jgi:hypothetical protein
MEKQVSTRRDRVGEMTDFFNSLLGTTYLPLSRPLFNTRTRP